MNITSFQCLRTSVCWISLFLSASLPIHGQTPEILDDTISPDKHTSIRVDPYNERADLVDLRSHHSIGRLKDADHLSNLSFVTSWSSDSGKVALVMYYGTKLNCLLIYQKNAKGIFVSLPFDEPDPMEIYKKAHGEYPFPNDTSAAPNNAVGPWGRNGTVALAVTMQLWQDLVRGKACGHRVGTACLQSSFEPPFEGKTQLHCSWVFSDQVGVNQELTRFESAHFTPQLHGYGLVAGESQLDGPNLFVTFDAQVTNSTVSLHNFRIHKLMSDDEADKFLTLMNAHQ
jgi:hypothetical protein